VRTRGPGLLKGVVGQEIWVGNPVGTAGAWARVGTTTGGQAHKRGGRGCEERLELVGGFEDRTDRLVAYPSTTCPSGVGRCRGDRSHSGGKALLAGVRTRGIKMGAVGRHKKVCTTDKVDNSQRVTQPGWPDRDSRRRGASRASAMGIGDETDGGH
jgi:hypothetical protein